MRYASKNGASPATAYWRAERSIDTSVAISERLACVTFTAECTACSDRSLRRSKASAFKNSANSSGAATMVKPISSSDRKERGYVRRIIAAIIR